MRKLCGDKLGVSKLCVDKLCVRKLCGDKLCVGRAAGGRTGSGRRKCTTKNKTLTQRCGEQSVKKPLRTMVKTQLKEAKSIQQNWGLYWLYSRRQGITYHHSHLFLETLQLL